MTAMDRDTARAWNTLLAILALLTLYRAAVVLMNQLPLYLDEAQYWVWSLRPDLGYYSKPPMVAWVIRLFSVVGDSAFAVKLGALVLHPLTAVVLFFLGRRMFDARIALAAAVLFISLPLVGFNSLFMTTDAPLFLFWGLATLFLWRALQDNAWRNWVLLGFSAGLGLMSKYSMAVFAPSVVLLLCLPAWRRQWRNPRLYVAAALAVVVWLPNLWWNAQMDFVSFRHTAEISQLDRGLLHPGKWLEFTAGQLGTMGPIAFVALLLALFSARVWRDEKYGFLAAMTLPFLGIISLQALLAKANVNWAAPTFFAGTLLVAALWMAPQADGTTRGRRWLIAAITVNLLLLSAFYHYHSIARGLGVTLHKKSDPYARVLGWPQLGRGLTPLLAANPDAHLAVVDRGDYALLSFYVRPHPEGVRIWNPRGLRQNHFHLVADMKADLGASFVFALAQPMEDSMASRFDSCRSLGILRVPVYSDLLRSLHVYRCDAFRGYAP